MIVKKPKIAVVFNLCNTGVGVQKALLSVGMKADLFISQSELGTPSDPRRDDPEFFYQNRQYFFWNVYDYSESILCDVKRIPHTMSTSKLLNLLRLVFFLRKNYDFIIGVTMGCIPAYFSGKPFLWFATGSDLRQWINMKSCFSSYLLRIAALKSQAIFTGRDSGVVSSLMKNNLGEKVFFNVVFPPNVVVTKKHESVQGEGFSIFTPASHVWKDLPEGYPGKGNDIFLKGVALFRETYHDFSIILLDRGKDAESSKQLVRYLNLEENVLWRTEMDKCELHEVMLNSDVVADQFTTGSAGTTCGEAMALGKPVLIYVEDWFLEQGMPVLNCRTPEDVCDALIKCRDEKFRREIGDKAKKWIAENASYEALGARLKKVIFESLGIEETL